MTIEEFRQLALGLPEAIEASHMGHADFRVSGKIFASLGYPSAQWGFVRLSPEQQQLFVRTEPEVFTPAKGAWGRLGGTTVLLRPARKVMVKKALAAAWRYRAPKALAREFESIL